MEMTANVTACDGETVVRPSGSDEYDLDTVCRREIEAAA
jgi:hypothetical protein